MKLLFDQNISPRLVKALGDKFPGSLHVQDVNLDRADDGIVWDFAADGEYIIVTKDIDFSERSVLLGFPPKIIWIRRGNCSTKEIEAIIRRNYGEIEILVTDDEVGVLTLY